MAETCRAGSELTLRTTGDDFQIAFQTRLLKLTERDYEAACEEAKDALTNPDAAAAVTLLGRALARVRVISGAEVEELLSDYMPRLRPERTPDAA